MQTPLDLKLLTTFVRAAHSGTLSATAIQVGRTQSTVTMQIQRLEETLGHSLFHRSGSGVALTGHGERFLGYAERILKLHDADPTATDIARTEQLAWVGSKPTLELHDFGTGIGGEDNTGSGDSSAIGTSIPLALAASNALDHKAACDAMDAAHMPYKISYASNSLAGLIAVARSGLAISVMMQKAVPGDLYILKSPLPPLPKLGLKVATGEGPQSPAITAFGDHIGKLLPFL